MFRKVHGLLAGCTFLFCTLAQAYDMPIGIPAPNFGAELGDTTNAAIPSNPSGWPSQEVAGFYYVDNTDSNATDSGNTYGFPDRPRSSLPRTLAAGSVVEVRGGPYNYSENLDLTMSGTASAPVYFYGVGMPEIRAVRVNLAGSYFVFDGFDISQRIITSGISYATIRNVDLHGPNLQNGASLGGDYIVFYNNEVHHHQGDDKHGVTVRDGSSNVWVLNNWLHHNGGDGIQFCHACSNPPSYVYVGGNTANGNRENAIDIKFGSNIVISQNIAYAHEAVSAGTNYCYDDGSGCTVGSSGSDGASIVIGSDGAPSNVWVLFNTVYDSVKGIRVEEAFDGVLMGNIIYDVSSHGIEFEKSGEGPHDVVFNTVHNAGNGIKGPWQGGSLGLTINNNILSSISGDSINIDEAYDDNPSINHNLFYNNGGSVSIDMRTDSTTTTSSTSVNTVLKGTGNLVGNPLFKSIGTNDFSILTGSSAIDNANSDLVNLDTRFKAIFGSSVTVIRDAAGNARTTTGVNHDIGAYESDGTAAKAPPSAPLLIN